MKDMNQDGSAEALWVERRSGGGKDSLNHSLSTEEILGHSSTVALSGDLKVKHLCGKRSDDNEVDNPMGTNLNHHSLAFPTSEDCTKNGKMEAQVPEPSHNECTAKPAVSIEISVGQSEGNNPLHAVRENIGSKTCIERNKCASANDVEMCDAVKTSDQLKPTKNVRPHCRSSIQDVHDSCLRMDVLPNVSPDSGIVSFEGSPFGNESPHSTVGGENSQENNSSPSISLDVSKGNKQVLESEAVKISHNSVQDVLQEQGDITEPVEQSSSISVSSNEMQNENRSKSILKDDTQLCNADKISEDTPVENQFEKAEVLISEEGSGNRLSSEIGQSELMTSGIILSSPTKISPPTWKKKKVSSVKKKKLQMDHKRSILYSNVQSKTIPESFINDENISETQSGTLNENFSDSNGNKVKSVQEVYGTNIGNLPEKMDFTVKRSPGRPKGSLNKRFDLDSPRRTYRKPVPKISGDENLELLTKPIKPPPTTEEKLKRPRGRPRKLVGCEESKPNPKSNSFKNIKKKRARKRVFTRLKKSNVNKVVSSIETQHKGNEVSDHVSVNNLFENHTENLSKKSNLYLQQHSPPKLFLETSPTLVECNNDFVVKKTKDRLHNVQTSSQNGKQEKSDFNDKDLEALLRSVKNSISSQFTSDKDNEDISSSISFDNPFKSVKTPSFPQLAHSTEVSPIRPKPKYKKPKLHVMMRKTKRKKKKKFESSRLGGFGASSPQKRLSFFTSHVQPSKLLASSRLNVFQTGTGVESNRSGTPTDGEQTEGSEKRLKKKRKLLNFKSKHKNIIDPVFAADLDVLETGLDSLAISENPADNFIRVKPGEMPLPAIFRVIKIDVMKRMKEKMVIPEPCGMETSKAMKSSKKEIPVQEVVNPCSKSACRTVRKKSLSDQASDGKDHTSLSDSSDQWLPPKKRHRMMLLDSIIPQSLPSNSSGSVAASFKDSSGVSDKRKGRRQKKTEGDTSDTKLPSNQSIDQMLTIDTSSYSTAGSSVSTLTPSPCPSRLSTRSSTIPSISSLSPTESSSFHNRHNSKTSSTLSCPNHSLGASNQDDFLSCAECQLLRRSSSTGFIQSHVSLSRSMSNHSVELNLSFEHPISSSESSPSFKNSKTSKELGRRSSRKRRKSSNYSAEEESSPPALEKQQCVSTATTCASELYSGPPKITPIKNHSSPQRQSACKKSNSYSSRNKLPEGSYHRSLRHPSFRSTVPDKQSCNTSVSLSHSLESPSVIPALPQSDWQPLPLEYCKKKEVLVEIQTALQFDSSDESSSDCEEEEEEQYPSTLSRDAPAGQPPRKRYQRVGLFSDFYKDDEPRKRCENMIRCRDKLVYVKDEHEYGLMPLPIHIGYYYMTQIQDFQLPYDIWWQDYHNQLPKKSEAKSKFRTIRSNIYIDGKASSRKKEIPACSCKPPQNGGMGCLDDCLNRMIYTECSMLNCPLGDNCGNQRIQKHDWAQGIEKFLTEDRGFGVRVTKPVKSGQFILEYLGEVVSEIEFRRRMMEEYSEECHHYALHLDSGNVIDGYRMGNIGRYVNHSCQPNCEMQKWNVNGLYRMVLFGLRDIEAYEELSYDYNFDAFNQETQQECRCGSSECRGVIGGKGQRNNGVNRQERMSDDSKDKRKSKLFNKKSKEKKQMAEHVPVLPPSRTMTHKERCYARKHSMFLVRNVDKVLNQRHPGQVLTPIPKEEVGVGKVNCVTSDVLLANLTESSVKTRLASFAKDNPEVLRRHQLAQLFDKMLTELLSLKDQEGNSLVTPLMSLPSRKKQPQYYQVVKEPIDMSVIKQRVKTGYYDHLKAFNADVMLLFSNVELYCGPKSDMGQVILKLRHIFSCAMQDLSSQIDEILGPGTTKALMDLELQKLAEAGAKGIKEPEEDIIRCICGVTRDEGLMLQCEKCMRWQHCDCVRASGKEEHYLCDRCEPRYYDPEILLAPPLPDCLPDCNHYMTLVKDDVQYAVGDCVYVMRDCKRSATGTPLRSSHRLIATSNPDSLDVFRIEQLWKDPKGERFASGTPYLRPQETFHEPTRKFFHNELFRTPSYEIIPLDLVMGKCVVMDPTTYSKGRPKGIKEQDIYICEYRVDKTAHLFHKIKEIWYPMNTSRFCFDSFEIKLALKRTFTPHEIPEEYKRKAERNTNSISGPKGKFDVKEEKPDIRKPGRNHPILHGKVKVDESLKHDIKLKAEVKVNVKKGSDFKKEVKLEACTVKPNVAKLMEVKRQEKRDRLDKFCIKLLNNIPGKQKIDLSYLLDGGRRVRKKLVKL